MEICEVCEQEITYGDDDHGRCGCEAACPCGCHGDLTKCIYAEKEKFYDEMYKEIEKRNPSW